MSSEGDRLSFSRFDRGTAPRNLIEPYEGRLLALVERRPHIHDRQDVVQRRSLAFNSLPHFDDRRGNLPLYHCFHQLTDHLR